MTRSPRIATLAALALGCFATSAMAVPASDSFRFGSLPDTAAGPSLASPTDDGRIHPPGS